jgi:uncharacterized protein (DUF2384 family)
VATAPKSQKREARPRTTRPASPRRSALELADEVLENPGPWLETPNPQLSDRRPIDLVGTDEEAKVYNLLNAVDQGLF